ncbi:riboflavin synthase [Phytomonospora endophytica]|uniref:Riboflavin synthase n=1 Tax=Phytomonospora endophytica TaxID=714109 RepID=A0A841FXH0_9ACTN|nr:riboflavin synthase [Phytomonospora endophytica]MBB6039433.1 riboflavin synthase [Phytomonospora endophytica]GIG70160.1 riboflavin synthase subunit alpha [Phytomonospora endophytica]
MFTGIVEELGEIVAVDPARLGIRGRTVASDAKHGDSIAVNGVCLTVTDVDGDVFGVDVMGETYARTALGALVPGDRVNLERAATMATRLGGHIVQGHVDGVGEILKREKEEGWDTVHLRLPEGLAKYIVEKGSITIDGVSLTVMAIGGDEFTVGLIPTTLALTTLGLKGAGDPVHFEVDILAKHVEKLLAAREGASA